MADKKISALTASTTPLAGTEVLPIVQSGATVKVAVSDLTAGRAVSATQVTLSTGNLIIGTAGQGIDFSANPAAPGMTSELLNDYEEGLWTPAISDGITSPSYLVQEGQYTKVGDIVYYSLFIGISSGTLNANRFTISGFPFTVKYDDQGAYFGYNNAILTSVTPNVSEGAAVMVFNVYGTGSALNGTGLISSNFYLRISGTYKVT